MRMWFIGLVWIGLLALAGCVPSTGAPAPVSTSTAPRPAPTTVPPTGLPLLPTATPGLATATPTPRPPTATAVAPTAVSRQPSAVVPTAVGGQPSAVTAKLGSAFKLGVGQSASVEGEGVRLELVDIIQDSRCPQGVQCVRAGDVSLLVRLWRDGQALGEATLSTARKETATKPLAGYTVTLLQVEPVKTVQEIEKSRYSVTLNMTKG